MESTPRFGADAFAPDVAGGEQRRRTVDLRDGAECQRQSRRICRVVLVSLGVPPGGMGVTPRRLLDQRCQNGEVLTVAGSIDTADVMTRLASDRPVFHSEADFQFAFARVLGELAPDLAIRLQVPRPTREYTDLVAFSESAATAIEFKYFTAAWVGEAPIVAERYSLKSHAADDLLRLNFVHDLTRLERYVADAGTRTNGIALLLTNHPGLWLPPSRSALTRDHEFRIHEDQVLSGRRVWGTGDYPLNDRTLVGKYRAHWKSYSTLEGRRGEFRWLALDVRP